MVRIGVLRGDGIGPEVIDEALRVLAHVAPQEGLDYELDFLPHGAEHHLTTGATFDEGDLQRCRDLDALLLGALGDPRLPPGLLERAVIGGLRRGLDLFVNLRPVKLHHPSLCPLKGKGPADVDLVLVRENTEGLYCGIHSAEGEGTPQERTTQTMVHTRLGVERIVRFAFELARARPRRRLTLVDKANALASQELWTRVFAEVGAAYPDVEQDHLYVDAAALALVTTPERFDVVVCENLFGDILSDLAAALQGGLGVAASANLHPGVAGLFEPVHGSAPELAGRGTACPLAAIGAVGMLLDFLGRPRGRRRIDEALARVLASGRLTALGPPHGPPTRACTEWVLEALEAGPGPDAPLP